jgi:hypothetical protein
MKKSNKILLGGFLTLILLITGIHITLYAKYKTGHYTIYQPDGKDRQPSMQAFPNVSIVTIRNNTAVISFGDTLSVEKGKEEFIQYLLQGDSIVITNRNEEDRFRNRGPVKLILPYNVTLSVFNSDISFDKGKENAAINPTIFLYNSTAAFHRNTQVDRLEVQLKNSSLDDQKGDIGQLSIATDSISQLMLQSKHLLKAKITSIPNNP